MSQFRVRFDRIGHLSKIAPLEVTVAVPEGEDDLQVLEIAVRRYALSYVRPEDLVILVNPPETDMGPITIGTGTISTGGRNAGEFVWTRHE